jgi:hypothetical protein
MYDGDYPVPDEWVEEHLDDEQVSFRYVMSLDDLIECDHIEGMNDFMDATLSMRKAMLTDISYEFTDPGWEDEFDKQHVMILATGKLEEIA